MRIECPHCGEACETDAEILVGQRVLCPFCNRTYRYGCSSDEKVLVLGRGNSEPGRESFKYCAYCGAKMESESAFCPDCGKSVESGSANCPDCGKSAVSETVDGTKECAKMQRLLRLMRWTLGIGVASSLVGCMDPSEYYPVGRQGALIFGLGETGLAFWLYYSVKGRRSWARRSFIVVTVLTTVLYILGLQAGGSENILLTLLSVSGTVIALYCAYLCLTKEVASVFAPDARADGPQATANMLQCAGYWGGYGVLIIALVVMFMNHYGTDAWEEDCLKAAANGSSSAREDLIERIAEDLSAEGCDYPGAMAREMVDAAIIAERPDRKSGSSSKTGPKPHEWAFGLRVFGKIIVGLVAVIGGFFAKNTKE